MIKRGAVLLVAVLGLALGVTVALGAPAKSSGTQLTGAGSTFVYPLVSTWTPAVDQAFGYQLTYGAVGSGAGIASITSRVVDFGASDAPLTPDQFSACKGCVQIPWALSATAVFYNVPGIPTHLKLTGPVLADIYLGKITNWNDRAIRSLNKGVALPDLKITTVHRSDGSGTTYNFADYLASVSPQWKSQVGVSTSVSWAGGIGAKGSSGVAGVVSNTQGAIGYADIAYALSNHLKFAAIRNKAGRYTFPGIRAIAAAASTVKKVPANNELSIVDPPKANPLAYPISTFTYVILPVRSSKAAELRKFIFWALTQGQQKQYTGKLLFVPIPKPVLVAAERTLKGIQAA
jgi:phosphate transport system substrate-binding protein